MSEEVELLLARQTRPTRSIQPARPLVDEHVGQGRREWTTLQAEVERARIRSAPEPAYSGSGSHSGSERGPAHGCTSWSASHSWSTGTIRPVNPATSALASITVAKGRRSPVHVHRTACREVAAREEEGREVADVDQLAERSGETGTSTGSSLPASAKRDTQ